MTTFRALFMLILSLLYVPISQADDHANLKFSPGAKSVQTLPKTSQTETINQSSTVDLEIEALWKNLDKKWVNTNDEDCQQWSTWLPEQGLRGFLCQLKIPLSKLEKWSKQAIFLTGPHFNGHLDFTSKVQFGHYNPEFVNWLHKHLIPAARSPAFRALTQPWYDRYMQRLARTFYVTHEQLFADLNYLEQEKNTYLELLNSKQLPDFYAESAYWNFGNLEAKGFSNYEIAMTTLFWIRRIIDGTEDEFFAGLKTLMETYDMGFTVEHQRVTIQISQTQQVHLHPPVFTFEVLGNPVTIAQSEVIRVQQLKIYQNQSAIPFQTIDNIEVKSSASQGLILEDVNFDGYLDIRLLKHMDGKQKQYLYWFFDPVWKQFFSNQVFEEMNAPWFDPITKTVNSHWELNSNLRGIDEYRYQDDQLQLIKQEIYHLVSLPDQEVPLTISSVLREKQEGKGLVLSEQTVHRGSAKWEEFQTRFCAVAVCSNQ